MIFCDRALALLANIRLSWKKFARCKHSNLLRIFTDIKSFITLAPGSLFMGDNDSLSIIPRGSKNLRVTNGLAYFSRQSMTTKKSFIVLVPGHRTRSIGQHLAIDAQLQTMLTYSTCKSFVS